MVVVMGDVHTTGLWTSGEFHVAGTVHAKELIYGKYNDNSLFAKCIRTGLLVIDDHDVTAETIEATHTLDGVDFELKQQWFPDLLDDESFEPSLMAARVKEGKPLFVNPQKKAKKSNGDEKEEEE